jgi:hypothetical protein
MPPVLFPSLIQGGLSAIQLLTSLGINPQRPKYTVPQEVQDKLAQNQVNLNARSAGAARVNENIFANQATTLQNAAQAGGGISNQLLAGAMAQANTNQALGDLSASEMEDFQRRLSNLGAVQSEMGQYRDREFDINKMQPFQDAAAAKSALIEGGIQNLFGASQGFAGLGMGQNKQQPMQPMSPVGQLPMRSMQPVQSMNSGFVPQSVQSVQPFSQSSQFWMPNLRWNYGK